MKILLDDPVDLKIRVSADRGGEVGIIVRRKTEMSHAVRRVLRLFHGAERQSREKRLLRGSGHLCKKLLHLLRVKLPVLETDRVTEIVDQDSEALDLLPIRLLMAAVQERRLLPVVIFRHGLVGRQHAVLDQHCRRVPLVWLDLHRASLCVQDDLALREIEVHSTSRHALFS